MGWGGVKLTNRALKIMSRVKTKLKTYMSLRTRGAGVGAALFPSKKLWGSRGTRGGLARDSKGTRGLSGGLAQKVTCFGLGFRGTRARPLHPFIILKGKRGVGMPITGSGGVGVGAASVCLLELYAAPWGPLSRPERSSQQFYDVLWGPCSLRDRSIVLVAPGPLVSLLF